MTHIKSSKIYSCFVWVVQICFINESSATLGTMRLQFKMWTLFLFAWLLSLVLSGSPAARVIIASWRSGLDQWEGDRAEPLTNERRAQLLLHETGWEMLALPFPTHPTKIDFLVLKCLMQQVSTYSLVPDHLIGVTVRVGKKRERGWGH